MLQDEIEKLQSEGEILQQKNTVLQEKVKIDSRPSTSQEDNESEDSGNAAEKATSGSPDMDMLLVLNKKLQDASELYDKVKTDKKQMKQVCLTLFCPY